MSSAFQEDAFQTDAFQTDGTTRPGTPQIFHRASGCCCTGTGTGTGTGIDTGCCDNTPLVLLGTITGCDADPSEPLTWDGSIGWNAGPGTVCLGVGTFDVPMSFRCIDDGLGGFEFGVYFSDFSMGPYLGTLVSCNPLIWVSDPIDLSAFGCTCGPFTVTVTE